MLPLILGLVVAVAASPRALLRRDDTQRVTVPLTRDENGRYSARIGMGPDGKRQQFHLALSTTAGYTVVAGSSVQHTSSGPSYQPANSPTYQALNQNANVAVGGQTASGAVAKEECALKNQDGGWWSYPNQTIIVAAQSNITLASEVSGILGLATKAAAFSDTFLGGLFQTHPQWTNFTYGMAINSKGAGTADNAGGALHLLDTDPGAYSGQVVTKNVLPSIVNIPVGDSSNEWTVQMDSYSFKANGGLDVGNSAGGTALIEPYVPNIVLPQTEARTLYASTSGAQQVAQTSLTDPISYTLPCSTKMSFTINFGNLGFVLTEADLVNNNNGQCTGVIQGAADASQTSYVLGNTFASVAYVIFTAQRDATGTNTVGFALRAQSRPASKVEVGAIVGGVLGAIGGLAILGLLGWYLFRKRKAERTPPSKMYSREPKPPAPGPLNLHVSALSSNQPGPQLDTDPSGVQYAALPQHSPAGDHIPTPYTYISSDSPNPRQEKTFSQISHTSGHSSGGPHSPFAGAFPNGNGSGAGARSSLTPILPPVTETAPIDVQSPGDMPPPSYVAAEAERPPGQRNFVTRAEKR